MKNTIKTKICTQFGAVGTLYDVLPVSFANIPVNLIFDLNYNNKILISHQKK